MSNLRNGGTPGTIHLNGIFNCKPSIINHPLGVPPLMKPFKLVDSFSADGTRRLLLAKAVSAGIGQLQSQCLRSTCTGYPSRVQRIEHEKARHLICRLLSFTRAWQKVSEHVRTKQDKPMIDALKMIEVSILTRSRSTMKKNANLKEGQIVQML